MADNALFATPDRFHWATSFPSSQGEDNLDRNVFTTPKGPTDRGMAHDNLFFRHGQRMGDQLAFLVHPLAGADHLNPPVGQHLRHTCFGLQKGMFLGVGLIASFDNDIGSRKTDRKIARFDAIGMEDIRGEIPLAVGKTVKYKGMEQWCVRLHRQQRISHQRQWRIVELDQFGGSFGLRLALGNDEGDMIGFPAHTRGLWRAARTTEHGLIKHGQPILINRHILGCKDGNDAGCSCCSTSINGMDFGVGHRGKDDLQPGLVRQVNIARIKRRARDFGHGILSWESTTNSTHSDTFTVTY